MSGIKTTKSPALLFKLPIISPTACHRSTIINQQIDSFYTVKMYPSRYDVKLLKHLRTNFPGQPHEGRRFAGEGI